MDRRRNLSRLVAASTTFVALLATLVATADTKSPFTARDLVTMQRVSDPQTSPDGRYVAFTVRATDLEANRGRTDIWLLDLTDRDATPRQLSRDPANDSDPRWAPNSRDLWFLSTRSGSSQGSKPQRRASRS